MDLELNNHRQMMVMIGVFKEKLITNMAELAGVTRADVKRYGVFYNRDAYWIETWNRRTVVVSGMEIERAMSNRRRRV